MRRLLPLAGLKRVHSFEACRCAVAADLGFLLRPEAFLITVGEDIGNDQNTDDQIEARFAHGVNREVKEFQMGQMGAFGHQQDADKEEDEKTEHFIHAVFLEEVRHGVGHKDHGQTRQDNGDNHERDLIGGRAAIHARHAGNGHGRQDRVDREDEVHQDNQGDGFGHRAPARAFAMFDMVHGQQMVNFFDRRIYNEGPAQQCHQGLHGKFALDEFFKVDAKERLGHHPEQPDNNEEQNDAEDHGNTDAPLAHFLGVFGIADLVTFNRDIEQIVKAEHGLEQYQHK